MINSIKNLFTPNAKLSRWAGNAILSVQLLVILAIWQTWQGGALPKPLEIASSIVVLFREHDLVWHTLVSTMLCFKAILYALIISVAVAYASTLPVVRDLAVLSTRMRYLTTTGLSFIFAQITPNSEEQKISILVFGITVYLVTSVVAVIVGTKPGELEHARTVGFGAWRTLWEVQILGKLDQIIDCVRQNFAIAWMMLAMVENMFRSQGGLGVILSDANKVYKYGQVFAVFVVVFAMGNLLDWFLSKVRLWVFPSARAAEAK